MRVKFTTFDLLQNFHKKDVNRINGYTEPCIGYRKKNVKPCTVVLVHGSQDKQLDHIHDPRGVEQHKISTSIRQQ